MELLFLINIEMSVSVKKNEKNLLSDISRMEELTRMGTVLHPSWRRFLAR